MKSVTRLFQLLEITRSQPQYGYALSGIPKDELSDLAQHHYLVTMIAWQIATVLEKAGCAVDTLQLMQICLVHDLGELFGGDISASYAKANPKARALAKEFEAENFRYVAALFAENGQHFTDLSPHIMEQHTLEAVVAKIADYLECTHYKHYLRRSTEGDITMAHNRFKELIAPLEDKKSQKVLQTFITEWAAEMRKLPAGDFFEEFKK